MLGFFFCMVKTAYEMRISDWSSDVCSSDLQGDDMTRALAVQRIAVPVAHRPARALDDRHQRGEVVKLQSRLDHQVDMAVREQAVIIAVAAEEHSLVRRL